ncbi:hypothetical protein [Sinanaerobacter sp. ZZT-01]|uniref:Flp family type IVb pilin n=1 Tax=Sinanaerobacter sp. ZZT-01 TaxID=3111540 RepID=UPI002D786474|nr:hypothetical protein [Sinanaerobacter sp. ZZT-01]WRR94177.1 hypothetical protein U5921_03400 [Sinanaerobacter sp. ZZT-01]
MKVKAMMKNVKEKYNKACIGFFCKLQKDESGMAGWEILLAALVGIVIVGLLLKAVSPTISNLWDSMVDKFKSLLTV